MPATTATATMTVVERLTERELGAWAGLLRAHAKLTRELDADLEAAHGLPLTSFEVLMHLADAEGERIRMSELADRVRLSRSGLTRLADRLESQGLIKRATCSSDARGSYAVLTADGSERLCAARATHIAGVRERFLTRLSAEEQELMAAVWARLVGDVDPDGICSSMSEET